MENYPNCRPLYDPDSINWQARRRVEMLSYRPPELLTPELPRSSSLAAAIFCGLCVVGLIITWVWFV